MLQTNIFGGVARRAGGNFGEDVMDASRSWATRRGDIGGATAAMLAPHMAFADADLVAAEIKMLCGAKKLSIGKIKLDIAEIPENGLAAPVTAEAEAR